MDVNSCKACSYDCLTCDSLPACKTCNASIFRIIDTKTQRCGPMVGYWENLADKIVYSCDSSCLTCEMNAIKCTSCFTGLFLDITNC